MGHPDSAVTAAREVRCLGTESRVAARQAAGVAEGAGEFVQQLDAEGLQRRACMNDSVILRLVPLARSGTRSGQVQRAFRGEPVG
jgi:hypothetical protein